MTSLLDAILTAFGLTDLPGDEVEEALRKAGEKVPDLQPVLSSLADMLATALTNENKTALLPLLTAEIADIKAGRFNPRAHASDA